LFCLLWCTYTTTNKTTYVGCISCFVCCGVLTFFYFILIITPFLINCTTKNKFIHTSCLTLSEVLITEEELEVCGRNCVYDKIYYNYKLSVQYNTQLNDTHITTINTPKQNNKDILNLVYPFHKVNSTFKCYYNKYNYNDVSLKPHYNICLIYVISLGILFVISTTVYWVITLSVYLHVLWNKYYKN
jgi:hypothetical protein